MAQWSPLPKARVWPRGPRHKDGQLCPRAINAATMSPARPLRIASLCQALALVAQALVLATWLPAELSGCLWGGGIMAVNFALMRLLAHFWRLDGGLSPRAAAVLLFKFVSLMGATAAVMLWAKPPPLGFMLGLGSFLCGVLGAGWALVTQPQVRPHPPSRI